MEEYNCSALETESKIKGKTGTDFDTKKLTRNIGPIKSSPEDSPLRRALEQPHLKRLKVGKTQDAGTITDPDSLGPCEPGTAINLDGIVWNETKGGLLSLNITWRGKSFMGTLMDCSETEHGSEWASPWIGDTEAPDQRPKVSLKKKKKSKKKRKGRKNVKDLNLNQDVSLEHIDLEGNNEGEDCLIESDNPIQLIECKSDNCGKKFSTESALKYHVSFAHEKVIHKKVETISDDISEAFPIKVQTPILKIKDVSDERELNKHFIAQEYTVDNENRILEVTLKKTDTEKPRSKPFPSTQNIRPIVPVQPPHIAGSSLKPIQPKPTILPAPAVNLCLDNLKRFSKKSPGQKLERSPTNIATDRFPKQNPKYQSVNNYCEEPMVIDLSRNKDNTIVPSKSSRQQGSNEMSKNKFPATNLNRLITQNTKPNMRENGKSFTNQQEKETQKQNITNDSVLLKILNHSQNSPKDRSTSIFVKTEFPTGHNQNLSDNTDQPEILKHTKSGANVPIPTIMSSIFSNPMGYMPHSYFSSQAVVPGLMMPPLNTNPLVLPGLMNIPPTTAPSSPFGSSLESLAQAAEERARNFGNYSPAHVPAAFSPAYAPAAFSPARIPPTPTSVQRTYPPPTSDSSESPLLRHEHMHTHLHYITSPTHSQ